MDYLSHCVQMMDVTEPERRERDRAHVSRRLQSSKGAVVHGILGLKEEAVVY
jgi:hypothetical protein